MRRSTRDLLIVSALAVLVFFVSASFDVFNKIIFWLYRHDTWQLDELFTVSLYLVVAIGIYAWRRHRETQEEVLRRKKAEEERAQLIPELASALADVHALKKLIPMCSSCKRARNEDGSWDHLEIYIEKHLVARIDEGVCPDCARRLYGSHHNVHHAR